MGLTWSRRKRLGKGLSANLSNGGVSVTKRGPRVSVNSRGKGSVRLGKGFRIKF